LNYAVTDKQTNGGHNSTPVTSL